VEPEGEYITRTLNESGYFSLDEILGKIERYIGLIK
jgi:hypothetical protein